MAQKVQVLLVDDLDGGEASETVSFSLDGTARARTGPGRERSAEIRAWARQRGHKVSERGRIPAQIIAEYEASH